jgi:hypothetical protein
MFCVNETWRPPPPSFPWEPVKAELASSAQRSDSACRMKCAARRGATRRPKLSGGCVRPETALELPPSRATDSTPHTHRVCVRYRTPAGPGSGLLQLCKHASSTARQEQCICSVHFGRARSRCDAQPRAANQARDAAGARPKQTMLARAQGRRLRLRVNTCYLVVPITKTATRANVACTACCTGLSRRGGARHVRAGRPAASARRQQKRNRSALALPRSSAIHQLRE